MAKSDLRKEQVLLWRFERLLTKEAENRSAGKAPAVAALTAGAATLTAAAASAADKLGDSAPVAMAADVAEAAANAGGNEALVSLAALVTNVHAQVQGMAVEAGLSIHQADGGGGKGPDFAEMIASKLMGG